MKLKSEPWKSGFLPTGLSFLEGGEKRWAFWGVRVSLTESMLSDSRYWLRRVKEASSGSAEACLDLVRS